MRNLSNRAQFLFAAGAAFGTGLMSAQAGRAAASSGGDQPTPDAAVARLVEGNRRYMTDTGVNCNRNYNRRLETAAGQMPFAIVLSCADSRVPAEMVFDQRVGDLFMVRVAGNIVQPAGLGSIEYAIEHFRSPVLMVLGHESCGAVTATLEVLKSGQRPPGHIGVLTDAIAPAVRDVAKQPGDVVDKAVHANVAYVAQELGAQSEIIARAASAHKLRIVKAYYALANGQVTIF
ncbi:MAG: carbonic anhydrase [Candidatus Tumulicola sp.]